ncbi:MAG: chromosome segregation protein SMC [Butyricicoccus sp.]|nr:chromosome segregation protein SMC [Butyricicoccus sp.]
MILKSLILQGFKSFPDRTEIRFLGGMTAIVGPNGSGKSNISDAIRWVLGEQSSRSLRGAKMEDVIFGGTSKRRAVGFAEVSLILDNSGHIFKSDFVELMVTRRYYRSGESEYFLNKKHCRLRDIHELFMDTGLGRDGYSVIGQGRIDEILALKSEDRREIFEEAAGVTKFRYRKEESERKLTATEENLVRIRDIYTELENQAGPLAKQAEKARQYLVLRDELRALEITLWLLDLEKLAVDRAANQRAAADCSAQLEDARAAQDACFAKSEQLAAELRTIEIEADRLRTRLREMEQERAERQSRCAVLRANILNLNDNITRARQDAARSAEQAHTLDEQLAARRERCTELNAEQSELQTRLTHCETALAEQEGGRTERVSVLVTAEARAQELLEHAHRIEVEQTAARTGLDGMESRRDTIGADIAQAETALREEEQNHAGYEKELQACRAELDGVRNRVAGLTMKRDNRRARVEQLTQDAAGLTAQCTDTANRIRMLDEMQREYEGFSRSVKAIMQRKANGAEGVHAPVSALITVDDEYVTAIETALGASSGHIVVDTAQVGKQCIEYLKRTDNGRATFLPLDTIRPAELRESGLDRHPGFCGTADELVKFDPRYKNIITNLLARTVVAENMSHALSIAKAHGNRFRIVTLDGQIIQSGGAMTGGSVSKSTGVLARASKLAALREQQQTQERRRREAEERLTAAKEELAALEYDAKVIDDVRARAQEEEARLTAVLSQHGALLDAMRTRCESLRLERDDLAHARRQYEETIARLDAALRENRAAAEENQTALQKAREAQNTADAAYTALLGEQSEIRAALTANRTAFEAETRAAAELEGLRAELGGGLEHVEEAVAGFLAEIERAEAELAEQESRNERSDDDLAEVQRLIDGQVSRRLRAEEMRTKAEKESLAASDQIHALERESDRLQSQAAQLQNQENAILDKMWENYELTPTPAQEIRVELADPAASRKEAAELRTKIRALGPVNPDAVQEYEALTERLTFMGTQKADLEKAQADLRAVIDELTVRMKEIFASEFAKLNIFFGETFREIFGGGNASLVLADTADILNCGIDIHVSLPGKSLKTITLLSGGEKALVATALYFAILKVRPTPFCILDEIEAALDDVNVVRFAKYLRRLTADTQFIVITHRRGTMEEADVLYGVTMQEQGVSKLLMLNLAEAEKALGSELK